MTSLRLQVTVSQTAGDGTGEAEAVRVVGVPVVAGSAGPEVAEGVPARWRQAFDPTRAREERFDAKAGQTMVVSGGSVGDTSRTSPSGPPVLVYVGCGDQAAVDAEVLRRAGAALVRAAGSAATGLFVLPASLVRTVGAQRSGQAVVEGASMAAYRFAGYRSEERPSPLGALVLCVDSDHVTAVEVGARRGAATAEAVAWARDRVNEPPSVLTPRQFADEASSRLASSAGVSVDVWEEERIADERLGGLLGVARGSVEPPRLLRAVYEPTDPVGVGGDIAHVVLVGKGITFDSGGLSLKTPDGMITMKTDMSGAAIVLAALSACAEVGVRVRVTAITPITENMPSGSAIKPGDVLTARNGKTIEVLNTDAEGRLVLADALSLATELEPDAIVDLATLTGACVIALGRSIAGLFTTDDALKDRILEASNLAGEPVWPLPLPSAYRSHIDSEIADMKNMGKSGEAGAIAAAMLLEKFTGDTPWAHLDIAGPARSDEDAGYLSKGGTGFGVRTLLELLSAWPSGR